jgi:hypothetical protein
MNHHPARSSDPSHLPPPRLPYDTEEMEPVFLEEEHPTEPHPVIEERVAYDDPAGVRSIEEAQAWCLRRGIRIHARTAEGTLVLDDGIRRIEAPLTDATWSTWEATFLALVDRFEEGAAARPTSFPACEGEQGDQPVRWTGGLYSSGSDGTRSSTSCGRNEDPEVASGEPRSVRVVGANARLTLG